MKLIFASIFAAVALSTGLLCSASEIFDRNMQNSFKVLDEVPFSQIQWDTLTPEETIRLVIANTWKEGMTFEEYKTAAKAAYDAYDNAALKAAAPAFEFCILKEQYMNFYQKPERCRYPKDILPFAKAAITSGDKKAEANVAFYLPYLVKDGIALNAGWTDEDIMYVFRNWADADPLFSNMSHVNTFFDILFSTKVDAMPYKDTVSDILKKMEKVLTLRYYEAEDEAAKRELEPAIKKIMLLQRLYK